MIKILKEESKLTQSKKMTALDLAKKYKFTTRDATEETGLAIGSNGMVAVQYDMDSKEFVIRPKNGMALDSQGLTKFKQDLADAEKFLGEISKL